MDRQADTLTLGVNAIDREHQAILVLLSKFVDCLKAEADAEITLDLLREAMAAGNAHMEHEEALMTEAGYPGVEEHKRFHRTARLTYTTLLSDVFAFQAHDPVLLEQSAHIEKLLMQHFCGPDRDFAEFLKARGMH